MDFFVENINMVLFLPVIMCAIIGFNGLISNKIDKISLFTMSIVFTFISLLFSFAVFVYSAIGGVNLSSDFQWLTFDTINFYLGTFLDKVSVSFLIGCGILCFIIQCFAFFKFKTNEDFPRLLFYLNLFILGFNGVFLSSNIFQSYVFCEVIGVASYLLINFDFSNRVASKAGVKSFIYNRIGDMTLLFCVLTIMYYSVIYNRISDSSALSYSNMNNIAAGINSLMSEPLFIFFCSLMIFIIVMKFMQAFVYITFDEKSKNSLSGVVFYQNSLISLIGVYLFIRFNPFFFELGKNWIWMLVVLCVIFILLVLLNSLFVPFCKAISWIEKYIVETFVSFIELVVRFLSYLSGRLQGGNFQSYLIYSVFGLVFILTFVFIFYAVIIKV